jgi:hypothetical protein
VDPETLASENGICFKATNVPNIMILFHNGSMMMRCVLHSNCVSFCSPPFPVFLRPETEFLDNSLTILLLSLLLADFKERKTILYYGLNNKKIRETRKLESFHEWHFVERKNEGRIPDKNSSQRRLKFMPRNLVKKCRSRISSLVFIFWLCYLDCIG